MQGDTDSIPGPGTKTPPAMEQLSLHTPATEPSRSGALKTIREPDLQQNTQHDATKINTCCNQHQTQPNILKIKMKELFQSKDTETKCTA